AKYTLEILHKHGMDKGQSIGTPMATKPKLDADLSGNPVDQTDYSSKIRSLMYLTSSRPDIVQAGSSFKLTAFSNADHARCIDYRKNNSGGIQFLGDKLVSWMSKKQNCTAMSSAEAEYVALSASCAQVMWMRTQLQDYGFNYNKIPLYCDSQSAIAISCNPVQHSVPSTSILVLRYDGDECDKGRMPTKIELTLEQSQQGVSNDVLLGSIEPANVAEAFRDGDWDSAMQDELDQFARLKHSQQEGIDYDEMFAPVARIEAIRLFLAYAAHKDFIVFQMNVKTTFHNEILKKEVYVGQPLCFVSKQYPDHMYALDKALYGLKQAPQAWYDVLSQFLIENGFQKGSIDTTLFIKNKVRKPVDHTDYRSMIGSLMYVTSSRPDIMFASCLWYPKDSGFDLTAYSDTDHAGYHLDRKSTSGSVQLLGDKL
nr:retrovirus-related Pol polyprotein from transposon TNT 1-94 [Tanacetum cinerariifolium]